MFIVCLADQNYLCEVMHYVVMSKALSVLGRHLDIDIHEHGGSLSNMYVKAIKVVWTKDIIGMQSGLDVDDVREGYSPM